ncbi:hypothetical protein [Glutamicibacter protophormiae]
MNRLRLMHPSELLFPLLARGTAAGLAVAALCIAVLTLIENDGYAVISILYGVPFGALYGLLVAGGVYAVLAFRHRRRPDGVMQRLVPTAAAAAAVLCLPAGILVAGLVGWEGAGFLLPAVALVALGAAVAAWRTQSALRATEQRLNAGRPEPFPSGTARG